MNMTGLINVFDQTNHLAQSLVCMCYATVTACWGDTQIMTTSHLGLQPKLNHVKFPFLGLSPLQKIVYLVCYQTNLHKIWQNHTETISTNNCAIALAYIYTNRRAYLSKQWPWCAATESCPIFASTCEVPGSITWPRGHAFFVSTLPSFFFHTFLMTTHVG